MPDKLTRFGNFMNFGVLKFLWVGLLLLSACLPEKGKEQASCGEYQSFDSKTRTCVDVGVPRKTPTGTLSNVTVAEDSGTTLVALSYTDINKDIAVGCYISSASSSLDGDGLLPVSCSCVAGICTAKITPDTNYYGLAEFRYKIADVDGTGVEQIVGVTVTPVDDAPVNNLLGISPLNGSSILEDTTVDWTLAYSDADGDKATACNIQNVSPHAAIQTACACSVLGVCKFSLAGTPQHYYGAGQFFSYQVYANGKWSTPSTVFFNITAVNDAPTLSATINYTILEGSTMTALSIGKGTGVGALYVAGSGSGSGSDVDNTNAQLVYTAISGPLAPGATLDNCMAGASDLDCEYNPGDSNYNDDYKLETVLVPVDGVGAPYALRLRAKTPGDLTPNITFTLLTGGSGGGATVSSVTTSSITVTIEDGVTTAKTIKDAIEAHAAANALIEVIMLGSVPMTAGATLSLTGAVSTVEKITYMVADPGGLTAGPATVNISITPVNDRPTGPGDFSVPDFAEDTVGTFNLRPGSDPDYNADQGTLSYKLKTAPIAAAGVLSGCMDLAGSDGPWDLTCTFTPVRNYSGGPVTFQYTTSDGILDATLPTTVSFNVTPVNDNPVICQYSAFADAPECGLNHCVGSGTPVSHSIVPTSHSSSKPVYWYDTASALCWRSNGATASSWEIDEDGYIADATVNQDDPIIANHIRIDEGGGDVNENVQTLTLSVESSNPAVIPVAGIAMYFPGSPNTATLGTSCTPAVPCAYSETGTSADAGDLKMVITPAGSTPGTSIIKLKVTDNGGKDVYQTFLVTVREAGALHNGWANLKALGPKIDRNDVPVGNPYVCSFSKTKCSSGMACRGTGSPVLSADELHAIYLDESSPSSPSCYLAEAKVVIGSLTYKARQEGIITIDVVSAAAKGVTVVGKHILIKIVPGDTDSDDIETMVRGDNDSTCADGDASCLVTVEKTGPNIFEAVTAAPYGLNIKESYVSKFSNVMFTSKTPGVSVEFRDSPAVTAGSEVVTVTDKAILVLIDSGNTTSAQVVTALNAVTAVTALVNVFESQVALGTKVAVMTPTTLTTNGSRLAWRSFQTYCAISEADAVSVSGGCNSTTGGFDLGASCLGFWTPSDGAVDGKVTALDEDHYYYDARNNRCYRGYQTGPAAWSFERYDATGAVTLAWKPFTVSGTGSITGYKVYRRLGDGDGDGVGGIDHPFDYTAPLNIRAIASDATSFTDDFTSAQIPPIPNTVYFYEVRPIIDGIVSSTAEVHRQVRIISPPPNMAFVHRWIVNQEMCELMHSENRDDLDSSEAGEYTMAGASNYYRCKYHGPGETRVSATEHYYDIGKDLLVDVAEAGCAYTKNCNTSDALPDGSCIGQGTPNGLIRNADGAAAIYYDRSSGTCYSNVGVAGTSVWTAIGPGNISTFATNYRNLRNAPLVNLDQKTAYDFCNLVVPPTIRGLTGAALTTRLPNRKHQIAFSQWDSALADTDADAYETGLSLNASSKCNSADASGLDTGYTDTDLPTYASLFSLPGDASSEIRSIYTGSEQTAACASRFGIQDAVGNVAEFLSDRFRCSENGGVANSRGGSICYGVDSSVEAAPGAGVYNVSRLNNADDIFHVQDDTSYGDTYAIGKKSTVAPNADIGPCVDSTGADGVCDGLFDSWPIEDSTYSSGRIFLPVGLPGNTLYADTYPTSAVGKSMFAIGSTNGITTAKLHNDKVTVNSGDIFASVSGSGGTANNRGCGAMVAGGGYRGNSGNGVWNFELIPCDTPYSYYAWGDMIFRGCVVPRTTK